MRLIRVKFENHMGWCIQEKGGENVVRQPEGSTKVLFFPFISNCVKTLFPH